MDTSKWLPFLWLHYGRVVAAPSGLGGQCVDLVELWAIEQGQQRTWGNAAELLDTADHARWTITHNTPDNFPTLGAIVVWGYCPKRGIGRNGHTSIAQVADKHLLQTLDQNWPVATPVCTVMHDYEGVLGWMVPRQP